jgi:hypothetical protein
MGWEVAAWMEKTSPAGGYIGCLQGLGFYRCGGSLRVFVDMGCIPSRPISPGRETVDASGLVWSTQPIV